MATGSEICLARIPSNPKIVTCAHPERSNGSVAGKFLDKDVSDEQHTRAVTSTPIARTHMHIFKVFLL